MKVSEIVKKSGYRISDTYKIVVEFNYHLLKSYKERIENDIKKINKDISYYFVNSILSITGNHTNMKEVRKYLLQPQISKNILEIHLYKSIKTNTNYIGKHTFHKKQMKGGIVKWKKSYI